MMLMILRYASEISRQDEPGDHAETLFYQKEASGFKPFYY